MGEINLANSSGRDAVVATASVHDEKNIRWLDDSGRQASSARVVKATLSHDYAQLVAEHGKPENLSQLLIDGDPEIDLEHTGRFLRETSRVYINQNRGIVRNVRFVEVIKNPDGTERERRPRQLADTNISSDSPLRWSGIFIPKEEAIRKFVFSGKVQIQHINGLTYDFLYAMAKDLEAKQSLMLLGAGPKSNQPLILRRGGTPYRGFLEGRTDGDRYILLLHFSNLELRAPKEPATESESTGAKSTGSKSTGSESSKANSKQPTPTDSEIAQSVSPTKATVKTATKKKATTKKPTRTAKTNTKTAKTKTAKAKTNTAESKTATTTASKAKPAKAKREPSSKKPARKKKAPKEPSVEKSDD